MIRPAMRRYCIDFASAVAACLPLLAQVDTATLLGTVSDPSGAVLAGAQVTAANDLTGLRRSTVTGADGSYLLPLIAIGEKYRITVEIAGFKTFTQTGIGLQLGQNARIDVKMQLGAVSDRIEVSEGAPLVDTYSSAGGDVVERRRIVELPLNGRNPLQLATLLPGVTRSSIRTALDGGNRAANFLNVNGSRSNEVDWQLDGVHFAGANNNSGLNLPNPDALSEFKLITNS